LTGISWGDAFCQYWIGAHAVLSVLSISMSNALVLLRVTTLWDQRRAVIRVLFTILFASTCASLIFLVISLSSIIPKIAYFESLQFCGVSPEANTHYLSISWAIPLIFDVMAIIMTVLNALDRPRDMDTKMGQVLSEDGLFYFLGLALLRLFNILVVAIAPASLVFSGAYLIWALVTTLMGRFLLRLRKSECGASWITLDGGDDEEYSSPERPLDIPLRLSVGSIDSQVKGRGRSFSFNSEEFCYQ